MTTSFKEVKHLGHIPFDWDVHHLDEITKKKIVYGIVQAGPPQDKGIPYIRSTDVGRTIDVTALLLTTENIAKKYSRSEVVPGDIVFSLRGNVGETSIVPDNLKVANLTQGTARISVKDKYSNQYVRYALSFGSISRHINAVSKGSTFREITLEDLRKIRVPMPPSEEQERIAVHLNCWDRSIDFTERLIAAKQERRTWLMQQLLTGKRRLPGFDKPWKKHELADYFKEFSRLNRDNHHFIPLSCSKVHGIVPQSVIFDKRVASEDIRRYKIVSRGDLIYDPMLLWDASIGFQDAVDEGVISPAYCTFQFKEGSALKDYFRYLFKSHYMRHQYKVISQGTNTRRRKAPSDAFLGIAIPIPTDNKEQLAIVKVFETADRELDLLRSQLDALREQKKGLMQQLLTGKVRVKI